MPDASILAGGTDLMVLMKDRLIRPSALISLSGLKSLAGISAKNHGWIVGPMTPLWQLERSELLSLTFPALHQAIFHLAVPSIRNRATLGGNICLDTKCIYYNQSRVWERDLALCLKAGGYVCHVAPAGKRCVAALAAETVGPLCLYDAELELASRGGTRRVALRSFYPGNGLNSRDIAAEEVLTAVHLFPSPPQSAAGYRRFAYRKAMEFSQLNLSAAIGLDDQEKIASARLIIGAIGPAPVELKESLALLIGCHPTEAPWNRLAQDVPEETLRMTRSPRLTSYLQKVLAADAERLFKELLDQALSN
jgi:4-hydroxybenzoyl-CoA reductase subunit beta